ncbi:MAG: hypothetical protein GX556_04165 [Fibrobacter sp.]|nr:hypothetical protein [Fibrobacter sp.]
MDKNAIQPPNETRKEVIPFLQGRPERKQPINEEDILNLKINLNVARTLNEFLEISG